MVVYGLKSTRWVPVLLHRSTGSWGREEYWTAVFNPPSTPPLFTPPLHPRSPSVISYLYFFLGRWHPVPATRYTLAASLLEPSSIHSKRGRSCKRHNHVLIPRDWTLRYGKVLVKPQPISAPLKELSARWGEERPWLWHKWVSPSGMGYHSSFVGPSSRALFSLGCSSFSRMGHVERISAELSPVHIPAAVHLFLFPSLSFPRSRYCLNFLLGPCHVFLPDTGTLVLCKQCPIFIVILIHTQAAVSVVSPRKACDHPGRNSQAPQNCAEERAVN